MTTSLLALHNVSLHLASMEKPILSDMHYSVQTGDFIIILGSNGSGKSSLLKLLNKKYQSSAGDIVLAGKSLSHYSPKELSTQVKTLTQDCHESLFTSLTVFENYLLLQPQRLRKKAAREFLRKYLIPFNVNLSVKLDQLVANLSGGEKQALALALIMLTPPKILLLDEHTSALDPHASAQIMQLTQKIVAQYNMTCLLTTHDLSIAENYGNRILALKQGKIHQELRRTLHEKIDHHQLREVCY